MRFFLLLLFFFLLFPSFSFAELKPCDYWQDQVDALNDSFSREGVYPHETGAEAMAACYGDSPSGSCATHTSFGYATYYYKPDTYTFRFYVVCADCTDECPHDGVCDDNQCEAQAECKCENRGGVASFDDTNGCSYECVCSVDPETACSADETFKWIDEPTCKYECLTCEDKAIAECGAIEDVDWILPDSCLYECKPPCSDSNPTPIEDCLTELNIDWIDQEKCQWKCECPDYQGLSTPDCAGYDFETCQCIPEDTPCPVFDQPKCPLGVKYMNWETCERICETCEDAQIACDQGCPNGGQQVSCTEDGGGNIGMCICNENPPDSSKPDPDGEPDGDSGPSNPSGGNDPYDGDSDTGSSPDPDSDQNPNNSKTCSDYQSECHPTCQFACSSDSSTGFAVNYVCDCGADPSNSDDGANGWISAVEDNTAKSAAEDEENNEWNEAIKHNSDEQLEDSDNIAENTRRGVDNDRGYFAGGSSGESVFKEEGSGDSVFKDGEGDSYLEQIADGVNQLGEEFGSGESTGSGSGTDSNSYDSGFSEDDGFLPVPEDGFSQALSDYIATGIPLVSWLEGSTLTLSSASPTLSFSFFGDSFTIDFSQWQSVIDVMGNLLLGVTILSSFMMIITRVKG